MKKRHYPIMPPSPEPKCDYEMKGGLCGAEACVAMNVQSSKHATWLCKPHVRPWLADHNLDLDDVL